MKILITGGLGLLGGRLGTYLQSKGHSVTLATRRNFLTIQPLNFTDIKIIDWNSCSKLEKLCKSNDLVIHSAGSSAKEFESNPDELIQNSSLNTKNLVEAAINVGVKSFIYLSSAHVYNPNMEGIIDEDSPTTNKHPYARSHLAAENEILCYRNAEMIEIKILRLSNCFGYPVFNNPNAWLLIANDLCRQAALRGSLILNSNINIQRDFLPIEALCKTLSYLLKKNSMDEKQIIFNIGSGITLTLFQLAERIQKVSKDILGFTPDLHTTDTANNLTNNPFSFKSKFINISKIKFEALMDQELKRSIKHFKNEL